MQTLLMLFKENFEHESRKLKLKFTIHIIINIEKEIREDCEKQYAINRLNIFFAIFITLTILCSRTSTAELYPHNDSNFTISHRETE